MLPTFPSFIPHPLSQQTYSVNTLETVDRTPFLELLRPLHPQLGMAKLGGKVGHQIVRFGGSGVGQILAAAAVALLFRLFSGPGPEEEEVELLTDDNDGNAESGEAPVSGKLYPVTIRWASVSCSVSDKSKKSVSSCQIKNLLEIMGTDCAELLLFQLYSRSLIALLCSIHLCYFTLLMAFSSECTV